MPELPEVETVVRQLRPLVQGATVSGVSVQWPRTIACPSVHGFRQGLVGRTIEDVWRRAKYLVFELDDGRKIVGHLRMTGRFHVTAAATAAEAIGAADPQSSASGEPSAITHVRTRWDFSDGRAMVFSDVRKFGRLGLVRTLDQILPPLGPEPLSDEFDGDWLGAALKNRQRRLKPLLLDQSFLAGLGNIYVDESLHRAKIHPMSLSHTVSRAKVRLLAETIKRVLIDAISADGSSFDTFYRTPEGKPGDFQDEFTVYGRHGKPCRTCGTTISRIEVGGRGTHFCRRCQAPPRKTNR
ncbi:MAG: formamidopyrimidine-DNA glycosylase [Pseudohongiellaceae bacterium]|jgi:formamidopyrimidine-DNA glycosylase